MGQNLSRKIMSWEKNNERNLHKSHLYVKREDKMSASEYRCVHRFEYVTGGTTESAHHFCWMELERLLDNPLSCVRGENPYWYPPKVTSHYQIMGTVHRYRQRHCIEQQYCWYVDLRLGKMHQSPASRSDIVQSFAVRLSVQRSLPEILSDS